MKLVVKYFGMIAEAIGKHEETLDVSVQQFSVLNLTELLLKKYSNLKLMSFKIAVNQTIVAENEMINESDEIALLPPFAGG